MQVLWQDVVVVVRALLLLLLVKTHRCGQPYCVC